MIVFSRTLRHVPGSSVALVRASQFSMEELTTTYNQARVDYLVPMQMNAARLAEYIHNYDVDLEHSWVAVEDGEFLGLAMLGVRPRRTWITRLGVLPNRRRRGTGDVLVRALLEDTVELGWNRAFLEVIRGNSPARELFARAGFREGRELMVLRRSAGPPALEPGGSASWLSKEEALARLREVPGRRPWTNEVESYRNAGDAQGLAVHLPDGGQGWMIFRRQETLLSHFFFQTTSGRPESVGMALLAQVFHRYPQLDTYLENIPSDDPHLAALQQMGFVEVFRRLEMEWMAEG